MLEPGGRSVKYPEACLFETPFLRQQRSRRQQRENFYGWFVLSKIVSMGSAKSKRPVRTNSSPASGAIVDSLKKRKLGEHYNGE